MSETTRCCLKPLGSAAPQVHVQPQQELWFWVWTPKEYYPVLAGLFWVWTPKEYYPVLAGLFEQTTTNTFSTFLVEQELKIDSNKHHSKDF